MLQVSTQTVVNWANQGDLPSTRTVGGHRRFLRTDVVGFARRNELPIPVQFLGSNVRKVLLVDDDVDLSDSVRQYFMRSGGFDVHAAASWFEFGRAVERHMPDLVLFDVHLPGGDGVDVPQLLQQDPKSRHIQVVAWMAADDADLTQRVRAGQFAAVVHKPAPLGDLLRRVQTLLPA